MTPEPAIVFEDCGVPGHWRVEKFDDGGDCEVRIFTGPHARGAAVRYAVQRYDMTIVWPRLKRPRGPLANWGNDF